MPQPLIELSGQPDAPLIHIAIANGFPPETYTPMLRPLTKTYRTVCFPPRALWGDQIPPTGYQDWWSLADDLLAGFDAHNMQDIIAVGHSFGAIASLLAVIKDPTRFKALILLDPTILMPNILDMIHQAWQQNMIHQMPLVKGAKRRRRVFDSIEDAFERFRGKSFFDQWSDETLRLYVTHGTQAQSDGNGVELTWSAEWEAFYFSTVQQTIWDDLPQLEGLVPTLILRGGISDTFVPEAVAQVKQLVPSATYQDIDGHGHLFPQSAPQLTSDAIESWLKLL
jgi:pimeloyl-ACP methyl ester carboxylesterase